MISSLMNPELVRSVPPLSLRAAATERGGGGPALRAGVQQLCIPSDHNTRSLMGTNGQHLSLQKMFSASRDIILLRMRI